MSKRWFFAMLAGALCALNSIAAEFPSRPIRLIVPFTPASSADILARMVGTKLGESWGQQVVVDNRPSAGGTVAGGIVANSTPDGHTLMVTSSAFAGAAALYEKLPYDPHKDFTGITLIVLTPVLLVTTPNTPVKTVKDLIALAQQKPGHLSFGSSGIGSGTHYAGELFNSFANIRSIHVPYRGSPEALTDLISGRIQYAMSPMLTVTPVLRTGRLLALGVTSPQRLAMLPDVPTIAEAGLPGFVYEGWFGVFGPARMPRALTERLNKEIGRIVMLPENQERIARDGSIAKTSTPEEFDKLVRNEIITRTKIFKAAGAKVQ
jgi:tripartite-type tricarboxylate transporter receptor subunit TctC